MQIFRGELKGLKVFCKWVFLGYLCKRSVCLTSVCKCLLKYVCIDTAWCNGSYMEEIYLEMRSLLGERERKRDKQHGRADENGEKCGTPWC